MVNTCVCVWGGGGVTLITLVYTKDLIHGNINYSCPMPAHIIVGTLSLPIIIMHEE